jgi:hypothetical protein
LGLSGDWLEEPSVYAVEYAWQANPPVPGADIARHTELLLADLAGELARSGCRLIGHLKALVQAEPEGHLYASLVSPRWGPSCRGRLPDSVASLRLTLNLIVYGLDAAALPSLVEGCLAQHLPGAERRGPLSQV